MTSPIRNRLVYLVDDGSETWLPYPGSEPPGSIDAANRHVVANPGRYRLVEAELVVHTEPTEARPSAEPMYLADLRVGDTFRVSRVVTDEGRVTAVENDHIVTTIGRFDLEPGLDPEIHVELLERDPTAEQVAALTQAVKHAGGSASPLSAVVRNLELDGWRIVRAAEVD